MAKVVWKTTPHAAYEWIEVEGDISDAHRAALIDEKVQEDGLVIVEQIVNGNVHFSRYGRYKGTENSSSALPEPVTRDDSAEVASLKKQLASLQAKLGGSKAKAKVVDGDKEDTRAVDAGAAAQTTEDARDALNQGVSEKDKLFPGTEPREDNSTSDKSDNNPVARASKKSA